MAAFWNMLLSSLRGFDVSVSAADPPPTSTRVAHEIRNPRWNEDRLGRPDRDGRRRGAARRRVPAGRRRQISGDPELRPLRQGPRHAGGLQEPVAAHRQGGARGARRLQQQVPELGAVRPGEVGAGRLRAGARGFARRRPLAGLSRSLVAARGQGHRALRRLGRRAAVVERQGRPARHLLLLDEPVAGGAAASRSTSPRCASGRARRTTTASCAGTAASSRDFYLELVSAPGHRRAARRRRPRRQERRHRRAGRRAADTLSDERAEEEPRRLRRRRAAPPADRRLLQGAAAEVRGHRGAAVLRRQLGRHGPASARQFRGLSARRLQAEMAGGARRHALHAVLRQVRPGPAAQVLRPFPQGRRQRLGQAAQGAAQHPPSRREVRAARRERMAARAHAMDQALSASRPRARPRAADRRRRR